MRWKPTRMSSEDSRTSAVSQNHATGANRADHEEHMADFGPEWCQKLLNDSSYEHFDSFSWKSTSPTDSPFNTLMRKTLHTDHTIRAMRYLYKSRESFEQGGKTETSAGSSNRIGGELLALISVGGDLCSHPDVLHGGINTVLVDEIGGSLAFREVPDAHSLMAVNFNVNLRKSVRTPGLILGRGWVERRPEGRKVWIKVQLEQNGQVCIEGEILYLKIKPKGNL